MRDPRQRIANRLRRKRRALLAIIMIASSPLMADGPGQTARVPLPLKPIAVSRQVQLNPFCQPSPSSKSAENVLLASGSDTSSIRLKPIGAAIGLQPIEATVTNKVPTPAMTIEKVGPSAVRNNPLFGSAHHTNRELVDAEVDDRTTTMRHVINPAPESPIAASPKTAGSSIILVPPAAIQPPKVKRDFLPLIPVPPSVAAPAAATPEVAPATIIPPAIATPPAPPQQQVAVPQPPVQDVDEVVDEVDSEPVFFSFSDRFDQGEAGEASAEVTPSQPTAPELQQPEPAQSVAAEPAQNEPLPSELLPSEPRQSEPSQSDEIAALDAAAPEPIAAADSVAAEPSAKDDEPSTADVERSLPEPVNIADNGPVQLNVAQPLQLDGEEPEGSLEPMESVISGEGDLPIAIYRSEPAVVQLAESPEATLHTKRYRPPVAVKPVPIAFERTGEAPSPTAASTVKSAGTQSAGTQSAGTQSAGTQSAGAQSVRAQSVAALNLDGFSEVPDSKLTPLYMSRAQVRSLTLGGEIRGVKVADEEVCRAFAAGPNQLKLIGTGNGVTRLVVWADADDVDSPTRMRTFEIHVKEAASTGGDSIGKTAELLNQSIRNAFPNSNVSVRSARGQLIVIGRCDSEASAKKIIRMVRKTCLVPVQDKLLVR